MNNPIENLDDLISILQEDFNTIEESIVNNELKHWIREQLMNFLLQVEALKADLDSGFTLSETGFESNQAFIQFIDEIKVQISNLKGLLRGLKIII